MGEETKVRAKGFDARAYVGTDANKPTSMTLKDSSIQKLPFIDDGIVDIYDVAIDASEHQGYRLVLRLSKLKKTFYIVNKKRKITKKIGTWIKKPDSKYEPPPEGCIWVAEVRKIFKDLVSEKEVTKDDSSNVAEMTICDYLLTRYQNDRLKTTIKSDVIKPVRIETIKSILSVYGPWLDKKIGEAKSSWPQDFKDYWLVTDRYNAANRKTSKLTTESMRKYYTYLNAMFGICVKRGYIAKNHIDGYTHLFERTKSEKVTVYEYDYDDVLEFIFSDEVEEKLSHKLIVASMIVTGGRNSEIYKNYRENFRIDKREVFIPGSISKNKNVSRPIPVESDFYWQMVEAYVEDLELNQHGHMFPSKKAKNGHVTDNVYRGVWESIKTKYGLNKYARLYNNRATYGTRLAREHSVDVAAKTLGDSLETTAKYYLHHDIEVIRPALKKMFNRKSKNEDISKSSSPVYVREEQETELVRVGKMPPEVKNLFEQFLSGRDVSIESGYIDKKIWMQFREKISSWFETRKASVKTLEWIEMTKD